MTCMNMSKVIQYTMYNHSHQETNRQNQWHKFQNLHSGFAAAKSDLTQNLEGISEKKFEYR